jgi:glycosyltransferase involved in cell wall biosynthesis
MQTMAGAKHGGAESFFERLAGALNRTGVEQRLVIRRDPDRVARLRAAGLTVDEMPFGGMMDFSTRTGLRRVIKGFQPRVVLSWMNRATKMCPRGNFVHAARLGGYYDLKYYKFCDHLIGNTRGIVEYIRAGGWPEDRVHYLPNFVTATRMAPISRGVLATPNDARLAVALGRLHKNKGFDVLIEAIAKMPRFHLWLAGEGPERPALELQAKKLNAAPRVHFLGWREDTAALLAAADIFVCPSRIEPLGNVVIEAWAAGTPVIAANADGPRELIKDGENGLLTPIENADALAYAMDGLVRDPVLRAQFKAAGLMTYETEFSEQRVVRLYKEFFEKVAR